VTIRPGQVRDAIVSFLGSRKEGATVSEIHQAVETRLGSVPASSVRSSLRLQTELFERVKRGRYRLRG
jgi:hypothetical protein